MPASLLLWQLMGVLFRVTVNPALEVMVKFWETEQPFWSVTCTE
jgi:hypothetical protein